ncbi:MAG: hypothetical protein WC299_01060 [Kiritimatiellia bacterium]
MNKLLHNAGFTLTEVLVASGLSVLVVAMVMTILVKNLEVWRDGMARLQLSEHSRIVRERILHGINGQYGLRHARRSQLTFASGQVLFTDAASSNPVILVMSPGQPASYQDYTGTNSIVRGGTFVESVSFSTNGNIFNIDLTLAVSSRGKTYSQPQRIRVYLLNE